MNTYRTILFPTDFSSYAEHATRYAQALAKRSGGTIHCAHVVDPRGPHNGSIESAYALRGNLDMTLDAIREHAAARLDHVARRIALPGIQTETHLRDGNAPVEIVKLAEAIEADLIVLPTHGRAGLDKLAFGSTYDKVIRLSSVPVLAIKRPEHGFVNGGSQAIGFNRILCPCDFSSFSHQAVPQAAALCRDFDATLILVHVVDAWPDYPEFMPATPRNESPRLSKRAAESLARLASRQKGVSTEIRVLSGVTHRELARFIGEEDIDIAVLATHGRSGLAHALLGSVTEKLIRMAPCPVMTLRPRKPMPRHTEPVLAHISQNQPGRSHQETR